MFDFNKVKSFDNHIESSIPNFSGFVDLIENLSEYFIEDFTNVYDLGCSTGKLLSSISQNNKVKFTGIDNSTLIEQSESKENLKFLRQDLTESKFFNASFITCIFTYQFLPVVKRDEIIGDAISSLISGGAFIIAEKTYSDSPRLEDCLKSIHMQKKTDYFSCDEIMKKDYELRSNMKRSTSKKIESLMSPHGTVEILWKSYNFTAWIMIKN